MSTRPSRDLTSSASPGAGQLETLVEIGNSLAGVISPVTAFQEVIEVLRRRWGAVRAAVCLLDPESGEIGIQASHGLTASGRTARYELGEGVLGRVVESGRPIVVPRISQEPMFLNRAGQRKTADKAELSYLCVPIFVDRRPVGAVGIDLAYLEGRDYEADLACLRVAATMIAQTIKADLLVDEERKRLIDENCHLPPTLQTAQTSGTIPSLSLSDAVQAFERDLLVDALKTTHGNRAKAARLLSTTPRILNYKVRKYQINHRSLT